MHVVKIRLRKPRRVLSFICDDMIIQRDDPCIVESDQGHEWGMCLLPPEPISPTVGGKIKMRVLRKANDADMDSFRVIEEEEQRAAALCQERIEKRNLPMQLVDVEYSFDRHKVTFYFTAENRVDFRELVRDLARELHSRIELRHIQVRDRAKLLGGLGGCGRVLCCASWLDGFIPISMRMAKCQNLSLNPGKISGQCGRLLCCLNYENEVYEKGLVHPTKVAPTVQDDVDPKQMAAFEDEANEKRPPRRIVVEAPSEREPAPPSTKPASAKPSSSKNRNRKKKSKKGKKH